MRRRRVRPGLGGDGMAVAAPAAAAAVGVHFHDSVLDGVNAVGDWVGENEDESIIDKY